MKSNIFIPKTITVGFQNRSDTYTNKLAYIIYKDEKGKLRKEASWNSWRDDKIPSEEFENVPTEGFVLNKNAGGYSTGWNYRQLYIRVYDPRGMEFEITLPNLLYILENTNSIKGKGLEGQFVYGWEGTELVLIPISSPDYKELSEYNKILHSNKKFKGKDLIIGGTYLTKDNQELVYMGRYDYHGYKKYKKTYFFYNRNYKNYCWSDEEQTYGCFTEYSSINNIIDCVSDKCCDDCAELFNKMEYYETYNPYDSSKDEYFYHTVESFKEYINNICERHKDRAKNNYGIEIKYFLDYSPKGNYTSHDETYYHTNLHDQGWRNNSIYDTNFYAKNNLFKWYIETKKKRLDVVSWYTQYETIREEFQCTIEEFIENYRPQWKREYLKDGKLRKEVCYNE